MSVSEIVQRLELLEEHCKIEATKVAQLWRLHEGVMALQMPHVVPPSPATPAPAAPAAVKIERVVLEVKYRWGTPPTMWNWNRLINSPSVTLQPGESVRVVEEVAPAVHRGSGVFDANGDEVPWEGLVAALEAERIGLRADVKSAEKDNERLRARVKELEAQKKSLLESELWGVGCKPSPADGSAKPVAWAFVATDGAIVHVSTFEPVPGTATVVPLYAAPQPASGWLTPEERDFLDHHRRECAERASTFSNAHAVPWVRRVKLIDALLARDTPQKVPNG